MSVHLESGKEMMLNVHDLVVALNEAKSTHIISNLVGVFHNLSRCDAFKQRIVEAGGAIALSRNLQVSPSIAQDASTALAFLSLDAPSRAAMVEQGVIPFMLNLLLRPLVAISPSTRSSTTLALSLLANSVPESVTQMRRDLAGLVTLLRQESAEAVSAVVDLLMLVARAGREEREVIRNCGGIVFLREALQRSPDILHGKVMGLLAILFSKN
eukprot:TRINITY_DN6522_c0_g3_i1.p1 TRINITY_DN6522_c0_g3~~TRINITY_DN6522_c0_g3_i1.p1  ORF type:complete len:248 (-),score=70.89 TRINITY_DN6522_c0_g3_i1:542-1180(-)